jgi:hypothetical protein
MLLSTAASLAMRPAAEQLGEREAVGEAHAGRRDVMPCEMAREPPEKSPRMPVGFHPFVVRGEGCCRLPSKHSNDIFIYKGGK